MIQQEKKQVVFLQRGGGGTVKQIQPALKKKKTQCKKKS